MLSAGVTAFRTSPQVRMGRRIASVCGCALITASSARVINDVARHRFGGSWRNVGGICFASSNEKAHTHRPFKCLINELQHSIKAIRRMEITSKANNCLKSFTIWGLTNGFAKKNKPHSMESSIWRWSPLYPLPLSTMTHSDNVLNVKLC